MKMSRFQLAGRKGGRTTAKRFANTDHFEKIGSKGGIICRTMYSSSFYGSIRRGVKAK